MPHKKKIELYLIEGANLTSVPYKNIDTIKEVYHTKKQFWIDVIGEDKTQITQICNFFGIHPSIVKDIIHLRDQRPKAECLENYLYWISRQYEYYEDNQYRLKKACTIVGENYVITFRENKEKNHAQIKSNIINSLSKITDPSADYLALLMLSTAVDETFAVIDEMTEDLEQMEELVMENPNKFNLKDIYNLKRKILFLTKLIRPIVDITHLLKVEKIHFMHSKSKTLIRKIHDNCLRADEILDLYQQMINNIYDMYLSTTNFYTNRSITLLTQFSTVFIPISFITSIYGMNFKYLPELNFHYAYPIVMSVCGLIAAGIWYYFRKSNQ